MDLEERVLAIVGRSSGGLTVEAVSQAYAKEMEKEIREALEKLAKDGRINRNRGAGTASSATYHRVLVSRRS